ncbi:MAG: DUF1668 domain-containing protein [candidate division Zixibacteria bacterium]|nr:DUF1668 domain-containing protein [candidate division Zixibacteria bacterium]
MTHCITLPETPTRLAASADGSLFFVYTDRTLRWDGTTLAASPQHIAPEPRSVSDHYGNHWRIAPGETVLQVRPVGTGAWQDAPPGPFPKADGFAVDENGFVWVLGEGCLFRFHPRKNDFTWRVLPRTGLFSDDATALARGPDGRVMAGFASGRIAVLDLTADGTPVVSEVETDSPLDAPIELLFTGRQGHIWAVAGRHLYVHAPESDAWQCYWHETTRLSAGNHDIFATALDGKLYIAGGLTSEYGFPAATHVFDEVFVFDPAPQTWTIVGRMPFPRCYNGIAVLGERIWIVGGAANLREPDNPDGPREPLADVVVFDPATKTCTPGPRLHTARIEPVVLTLGDRIYAIGGADPDNTTLDSVESIGEGETTWRQERRLPVPMRQFAGCTLDDVAYVAGKEGFFAYTPAQGIWYPLPYPAELPQAPLMATHQGEIWVMGGYLSKKIYRYTPETRTWRSGPDLPGPRSWGAAWSLDGRLYVIGGAHYVETHRLFTFDDQVFVWIEDSSDMNPTDQ